MIPSTTSPSHPPATQPIGRRILFNTGALAGSSLWRIAISFALQLVIARQLGVEALGLYTVALAYLNVSQIVSELGMPALLVRDLAHAPFQRRGYFFLALRVQIVAALLTWTGLILLTWLLPFDPMMRRTLWLVGASLPLYAVTSVSQTLFQAAERMELVMGVEVLVNLLIIGISLIVLWLGGSVLYLIAVLIVTQAISAALCIILLLRYHILAGTQHPLKVKLSDLWRRSSPFFGLSIADVLLQRMDIILLSIFGGAMLTGIYSAAYNLVRVLVKLIQSFWQALYPTLSRLFHQSSHKYPLLAGLSLRFGIMVLVPCAILASSVAGELMNLIYSQGYDAATPVFQRLVWLAPIFFVETYAVTLLMVEHHPFRSLAINGLHLLALVFLLPFLTIVGAASGAAWASVLAGLCGAIGSVFLLRKLHIVFQIGKFWPLLFAAIVTQLTAVYLPLPWIPRVAASAVLYLTLIGTTGVIAPADLTLLRRSLLRTGDA